MNQQKIRIMHVVQSAGGVEQYLVSLLKYMDRGRFENILVCSQDFTPSRFEGIVSRIEVVPMQREIGGRDAKAARAVRKLIRQYRPDIVYAHSSKAGAIMRLANVGMRNVSLYNPHGWAFNMHCSRRKQRMYRAVERMTAPMCDKIICISEAERESALSARICRDDKLRVIVNGVDVPLIDSRPAPYKRSQLGIPEKAPVVGMVGRLSKQKAPDVFLEMAKRVRAQYPNAHFVLVGGGEMIVELQNRIAQNRMQSCVHITEWTTEPLRYADLFDVAVLLSRWEGFGLVLPEYMLLQKPLVATNVDAIPTIVRDGYNGLLVPPDDPGAAAEAVLRLLDDSDLRERLKTQAERDARERFDVRRVAKSHGQLFEELLKNKG